MKRIYFVALLLLTSLLCISYGICKSSNDVSLATPDGSFWVLIHTDGIKVNKDVIQTANINISKGRISGRAACNSYGVECLVHSDGRIKIGDITSTLTACDRLTYERILLALLGEAKTLHMSGPNKPILCSTHDAPGQPDPTSKRK